MEKSREDCLMPILELAESQFWEYHTDEFVGICEIAKDEMVVRVRFWSGVPVKNFYDVLAIDGIIRSRLTKPVSVERLTEQLSLDFPSLSVEVSGRAKTHGWITSKIVRRWGQ